MDQTTTTPSGSNRTCRPRITGSEYVVCSGDFMADDLTCKRLYRQIFGFPALSRARYRMCLVSHPSVRRAA